MTRRLIVNADDFGRSPGITRGIIDAHRNGIVTSTTLMVNLPWSAVAVQQSHDAPGLGLGLHLSFCYGPPLSCGVETLLGVDGNLNRDLAELRERADPCDVERECRAQLGRFRDLTGTLPTHLDSHQHVHAWPGVAEAVATVASENGLPVRACTAEHAALLRAAGTPCPDRFIASFFGAGNIDTSDLRALLRDVPDGTTELMCHPGYDDDALTDSSYRSERESELRALCSTEIRETITSEGIELVTFAALHQRSTRPES